jgi:putative endonuclease
MPQHGYFYIMTNAYNNVLYCGATTDLYKRVMQHKNRVFKNSFTLKYNTDKLVYFESFTLAADAFIREKQMKAGSRKKKLDLVGRSNPEWKDLFKMLKQNHQSEELIRMKKLLR